MRALFKTTNAPGYRHSNLWQRNRANTTTPRIWSVEDDAAKFYRITGDSTQHRGIIPDLRYPDDYDPEAIGESTLTIHCLGTKFGPRITEPRAIFRLIYRN